MVRFTLISESSFASVLASQSLARKVVQGVNAELLASLGVDEADHAMVPRDRLRDDETDWLMREDRRLRREGLDPLETLRVFDGSDRRWRALTRVLLGARRRSPLARMLGATAELRVFTGYGRPVFLRPAQCARLARRQPDLGESVLALAARAALTGAYLLAVEVRCD